MNDNREVVQGTLDLLILSTLKVGALHGWGISRRIRERSSDVVLVTTGSLYPALHRLESKRLIKAEWRISENNRRARFYTLTARGEKVLGEEVAWWNRFVLGVTGVIAPACPQPQPQP